MAVDAHGTSGLRVSRHRYGDHIHSFATGRARAAGQPRGPNTSGNTANTANTANNSYTGNTCRAVGAAASQPNGPRPPCGRS